MTKYRVEAIGGVYKHVSDTPRLDHAIEDALSYNKRTFDHVVVVHTASDKIVAQVKAGKLTRF